MNDFSDLIESMLNIQDDGILHNERDGLRLTQIAGNNKVLSFYGAIEEKSAVWALSLDSHRSALILDVDAELDPAAEQVPRTSDGGGTAVLTLLAPSGPAPAYVGINQTAPNHALDVGGTVASRGRIGARGEKTVPANGEWHAITETMIGCQALEVMAGVGKDKSGRYALMHAYAMKTFDAKGHITYHQAHYGSRRNKIQLRWAQVGSAKSAEYELQMRVDCNYGEGVWIQYYITTLWFDERMQGSAVDPDAKEPS